MRPRIIMVAALGQNRVIGRDGQLPWRLPDDMKHFRALTLGKPVVMGRKTYESMGKPLKDRMNVVLSRSPRPIEGCVVVGTIEEALAACGEAPEIAVIGGGAIYEAFLPLAHRLELTLVDAAPEGDAHFPAYGHLFREIERREHPRDDRHAVGFAFTTWQRVEPR